MCSKPNKSRVKKTLIIVLIILLSLVLILSGIYAVMFFTGKVSFNKKNEGSVSNSITEDESEIVSYNGKSYKYNENVVSILVMGIDKKNIDNDTETGSNGQADALMLAAIDTTTGKVQIIPISRETMVEVDQYSANGSLIGSKEMQLCLAYAYADNGIDSCKNVCRSVSRLMYGINIDSYIAINTDGVSTLTDVIGGVRLTSLEDILYSPIYKGKSVNLKGENAVAYIRFRGEDINSNGLRMQRQKQFFEEFIKTATSKIKKDITYLTRLYDKAKPYVVSDLTLSQITYLATTCLINKENLDINYLSITGETVAGEKHFEFYPDENSIYEVVLTSFYKEVQLNTQN